jgi:hypothetical protein
MDTLAAHLHYEPTCPVGVHVEPAIENRNRLTTAFRIILALPHVLLVGGPLAATLTWSWTTETGLRYEWGTGGGALGVAAAVVAFIAWFAIVFTGRYPQGLWNLAALYLHWRVRAVAYTALLRDEYPPFGEAPYPAKLELYAPDAPRDRLTAAFRIVLVIPHLVAVLVLNVLWALSTMVAWFAILLTGRYPVALYDFALGVFRWNIRVEAYLLLLRDEYPPFLLGHEHALAPAHGTSQQRSAP